jgi:hypothetical protein
MTMPARRIDEDTFEITITDPASITALGSYGLTLTSDVLVVASHANDADHEIQIGLISKLATIVSADLEPGASFPVPRGADGVRIWLWGVKGGVIGDKVTVSHGGGFQL